LQKSNYSGVLPRSISCVRVELPRWEPRYAAPRDPVQHPTTHPHCQMAQTNISGQFNGATKTRIEQKQMSKHRLSVVGRHDSFSCPSRYKCNEVQHKRKKKCLSHRAAPAGAAIEV